MDDKMHRANYTLNTAYLNQHQIEGTMSVVPQQISTRPNTLSINGPSAINPLFFTPTDYSKFSLSTPDMINVLSSLPTNEGTPSPGAKVFEEIFAPQMNNLNNQPMASSGYPYAPMMRRETLTTGNDYSISSSMNDNESSNSTTPSSPLSVNRARNELQHVPGSIGNFPAGPKDVVRKEKKRERNRQAAQKCRTRKLTRIAELQKRVNELQGKNKSLTNVAENLQTDIVKLEKQLHDHHTHGCTLNNGSTF